MSNPDSPVQFISGQLTLPFIRDEYALRSSLEKLLGKNIVLIVTDNRTSMLSVRKGPENPIVRIHRMFLQADERVIHAVADFIRNRKPARPVIQDFIRKHSRSLKSTRMTAARHRTDGVCHCLATLFNKVNTEYFQGEIAVAISWGRRAPARRARRVTLGSYCRDSNIVRINPLLDCKTVPAYFLEFIIYHELLHAYLGIEVTKGRRSVHSKEFRRREKLFAAYGAAVLWEKKCLVS